MSRYCWLATAMGVASLALSSAGADASPPGSPTGFDRFMQHARTLAYQQNLYVDASRLDEGLLAIVFHSDGLLELHEPAVAAFRFNNRGRSVRYRLLYSTSPPPSGDGFGRAIQERLRRRVDTTCSAFLEALDGVAADHGIKLRRAGSRVLELLLAEEHVDVQTDPALVRYSQAVSVRFRDLPGALELRAQGLDFRMHGEYLQAKGLLSEALEAHRAMLGDNDPHVALILNELALVNSELGDRDRAAELYDQAMQRLRDSIGLTSPQGATVAFNLSMLYSDTENEEQLATVRTMVEHALDVHRATAPADGNRAKIHNGLGLVLRRLGELDAARAQFESALEIYTAIPSDPWGGRDDRNTLPTTINLAELLLAKGDIAGASRYFDGALRGAEKLLSPSHPTRVELLFTKAFVEELQGDTDRAAETLRTALAAEESFLASTLPSGSSRQKELLLEQYAGYLHSAVSFHLRAAPHSAVAATLALNAVLQRKARLLDAESRQRFANRPADPEELESAKRELRALEAEKARIFWNPAALSAPGDRRSKLRQLDEAIDRTASKLAHLAASLDHFLTFQALNRERDDEGIKEWAELSVEEKARVSARDAAVRGTTWESPPLDEVQAAVPRNAALIEFFVYLPVTPVLRKGEGFSLTLEPPRYVAYVLHRTGTPRFADLGPAEAIDGAAEELRAAVASRRGDVRDRARAVDALTMERVRPLLDGVEHLILSPDGALNLVPFAALVDSDGRYLIEGYDLSLVGGGREVLGFGAPPQQADAPLILGGVDFGEASDTALPATTGVGVGIPELASLPGTRVEADVVGALLRAPRERILLGPAATEAAVKGSRGPRILHIATHGLFLPDRPDSAPASTAKEGDGDGARGGESDPLLRSALALAGFNRRGEARDANDGALTALEVAGLDLRGTEVAVLSACDTGVGEVQVGEGVFGLRRAFAIAGARTLLMSLWPVADQATKDLMASWYAQLLGGVSRSQAMRQTQLAALRGEALPGTREVLARGGVRVELSADPSDSEIAGSRHPFYWASFIVSGEPGPLPSDGAGSPR